VSEYEVGAVYMQSIMEQISSEAPSICLFRMFWISIPKTHQIIDTQAGGQGQGRGTNIKVGQDSSNLNIKEASFLAVPITIDSTTH